MKGLIAPVAIALSLAACTPEQPAVPETENSDRNVATNVAVPINAKKPTPPRMSGHDVLTLDGLGDLRIGQPIPAGSTWAEHGVQVSDTCRTISSADFPGIYAIVEDGKVRRITAGQRSSVRLVENIGVGATEEEVLKQFPDLRSEPHKYVAAPAKYLTTPSAASGDPALRFEIGADGKVSLIHVGTMPVLGYVEGCA